MFGNVVGEYSIRYKIELIEASEIPTLRKETIWNIPSNEDALRSFISKNISDTINYECSGVFAYFKYNREIYMLKTFNR